MLDPPSLKIDGELYDFFPEVRTIENLPVALQFWMAYLARDLLQLGVFFRAAGIMCQVPGVDGYRFILCDDSDDDRPDGDEDPGRWLDEADNDTAFNVLGECLRRLEAEHLMNQVPGATDYAPAELSAEWKAYLDRWSEMEHGLLNVVAECLDHLIVRPGMAEIDAASRPTWWQEWWGDCERLRALSV